MNAITLSILAGLAISAFPVTTHAQSSVSVATDVVSVELLEGWREPDGRHIAAIRLSLAQGWKTYWRAPGDGGLPTSLNWSRSGNLADLKINWPRPEVFEENGIRSLGYRDKVVLPLVMVSKDAGEIALDARLSFGVCKEVCVPVVANLRQRLPANSASSVSEIQAALQQAAIPSAEAGVQDVSCDISETEKGHRLQVIVNGDIDGTPQAMVVEAPDNEVWVSRTHLKSSGSRWTGLTHIFDHRDRPQAIDTHDFRITLLTDAMAVDIQGCDAN